MIDTPTIADSPARETATIHLTIARAEIQQVMGPAIGEVMAAVAGQAIAPTGPVFSHHFKMSPDVFDFEVGVPVSAPIEPTGRVQPSKLPAAKVARTIYHGPYEGLGTAWGEFCEWLAANGHTSAGNLWEFYVKGPESSGNPADWQTELVQPLVS
ncbi:MAG: GyrI-like domain-containing protein [Pirellulales bacterium]